MKWRAKIIWKDISHGAFSVSWSGADRHFASAASPKIQNVKSAQTTSVAQKYSDTLPGKEGIRYPD